MATVKDAARLDSIVDRSIPKGPSSGGSYEVTPSDTENLSPTPRELFVGGAGDLTLMLHDDTTVTFTCAAGQTIVQRPKRVMATDTTATGIVAIR